MRLRVRARRRDSTLFDGFFVVTPEDAELLRVEGRLARSPSFWIPRADVVRHFARVGGHRVVVRCESTAQLRLLGESRLVVSYDYEMIDGRLLPSETVASSPLPEPDVVGSSQTRP